MLDILMVTGDKSTTKFTEWLRFRDFRECSWGDLYKTLGGFTRIGRSATADCYLSSDIRYAQHNTTCETLLWILGLTPHTLNGPIVIHFHDGVCRRNESALALAQKWHAAYMADDADAINVMLEEAIEDTAVDVLTACFRGQARIN